MPLRKEELMDYGKCDCGEKLVPIWYVEEETEMIYGTPHKTGRKRNAVNYLFCESCGEKHCVDDSFDGYWHR